MSKAITRKDQIFQPGELASIKPKGKLGWHRDVYKIENHEIHIKKVGPLFRAIYQLRTLFRWATFQSLNEHTWTVLTENRLAKLKMAKPIGMPNLGQSCYMNATVQAFLASKALLKRLEEVVARERTNPQLSAAEKEVLNAFARLANALRGGNKARIKTAANKFHKTTYEKAHDLGQDDLGGTERFMQRDPIPLATLLINVLQLGLPGAKTLREGEVTLEGMEEPFNVDPTSSPSPLAFLDLEIKKKGASIPLQDLIQARVKHTVSDPNNPWKPNEYEGALSVPLYTETLQLPAKELPPVLMITLKRAISDVEIDAEGHAHKDTTEVTLPKDGIIELKDLVDDKKTVKYRIVAAINHQGDSTKGGHYVADIYPQDTTRFRCDDITIHPYNGYLNSQESVIYLAEKLPPAEPLPGAIVRLRS